MKKIPSIKKQAKNKLSTAWLIGIDEVGRGPLAGPVTVCLFATKIVDDSLFRKTIEDRYDIKLNDSKKISHLKRVEINKVLKEDENCKFLIKSMSSVKIDKIGIAVCIKDLICDLLSDFKQLTNTKEKDLNILLDGSLKAPKEYINQETHIKGDVKFAVISCASIVAKVNRDDYMVKISKKSPYKFDINKGYGTKDHIQAILQYGAGPDHRMTFLRKIVK